MSDARLGKDVYLALAAVGWADGNLDSTEADGIVKMALEEELPLEEISAIEAACKERVELGTVDTTSLDEGSKRFVFAVAAWLATLDGELAAGEKEVLGKLAGQLGIDAEEQADIDIIVREVAYASGGDSPFEYDLRALRARFDS
ncbi:MAG: hypothetical protein AAGE52_05940 [Myxococcota bacterium]